MAPLRELQQPQTMASDKHSDDEFGFSSGDEAEMLKVEDVNPLKRKSDFDLDGAIKAPKPDTSSTAHLAQTVLQNRFGLDKFQLKQQPVIDRLLNGRSAVVVFPTGGGKSLCYQLPAVCFREADKLAQCRQGVGESGITLVISPLIALMKDQVDALRRRGINAAAMDSTKSKEQYLETVEAMRNGSLDILYCAPERLNNEGFVSSMASVKGGVRLLAVDEAHCISEWGHAFRPDYLKVARFAEEIQAERVVCLTATATPAVATDICKAFDVPEDGLFRTTTYRPNLRLHAQSFQTKKESYPELQQFLSSHPGSTIIYVTLQRHTEELSDRLRKLGFDAHPFHAGMQPEAKAACQDSFMTASNMIIVATIAFGMGIDKRDIRNVIHYDIPASLEGYSQEIGRAGRDGLESHCILFLCAEDLHLRESFARGDLPSKTSVQGFLGEVFTSQVIETQSGPVIEANVHHQSVAYDIRPTVLNNIYAHLELRSGLLRASTPKYTSYSYVILKNTNEDKSPAAQAVRTHSKTKAKWTFIDIEVAARSNSLSRFEIVTKLNNWHDNRLIELRTSGVINVFRIMQSLPSAGTEQQKIADEVYADLEARERQALARMEAVLTLTTGAACLARNLARHFGDSLPSGKEECGHCTWCETRTAVKRVAPPVEPWDSKTFFGVLEAVPARDDPRFLARVAFGIISPRVTKEKLSKNLVFGSMENYNFVTLLNAFTKVCAK